MTRTLIKEFKEVQKRIQTHEGSKLMREANSVLFTTVSTSTGLTIMPRIS